MPVDLAVLQGDEETLINLGDEGEEDDRGE